MIYSMQMWMRIVSGEKHMDRRKFCWYDWQKKKKRKSNKQSDYLEPVH